MGNAKGCGPVFEIRRELDTRDKANGGEGYDVIRLAQEVELSADELEGCEASGRWPQSPAVISHIRGLADAAGLELTRWPWPGEDGVFL